tara:strand:+ start:10968 stop:11264 length:297 start_codon:yes stop_codon:yes gene_type:complete
MKKLEKIKSTIGVKYSSLSDATVEYYSERERTLAIRFDSGDITAIIWLTEKEDGSLRLYAPDMSVDYNNEKEIKKHLAKTSLRVNLAGAIHTAIQAVQ